MSDAVNLALLEGRIAELEARIELLAPNSRASSSTRSGGIPPKPTGLTLGTQPGVVSIKWSDSPISDLSHYVVQVADDSNFVGAESYNVGTPTFPYYDGVPDTTYFFRVAVVNTGRNQSDWSATLNSATGQVGTTNIEVGAAAAIYRFAKSSGFTTLDTDAETETYGPVVVEVSRDDSVVLPLIVFEADIASQWSGADTNSLTLELLRRPVGSSADTVIDSVSPEFKSTVPDTPAATARTVLATFTTFDSPGAGDFEYRVRLTTNITGANVLQITGANLTIEMVQLK